MKSISAWTAATVAMAAGLPLALLAASVDGLREVCVPDMATGALSALIGRYAAGTVVLSSATMLVVQAAKKLLAFLPATFPGGGNAKWLVGCTVLLAAVIEAASDGQLTSADWGSLAQAVIAGVAAYFGYKPLFKQPSAPGPSK